MNDEKKKDVQVLMKNNVITKAKFNITTVENRIFQLVMFKLQRKAMGLLECKIHLDEFKEVIKNKNQLDPESISEILVELRKQSIYFKKTKEEQDKEKQDAEKKSKKSFSIWGEWGIINGHEFDEETETFTIEASEKVHSLLHDYLEGGYTPVNLSVFFSLSNSYAQRFYDLLRLWSYKKRVINYKVDELKELLMLDGKYPRFVDFKRRVLNPAIEELNKSGMFKIEVKEIRSGRAVDSLDFIVEDNDKRIYFEKEAEEAIPEIPETPNEGDEDAAPNEPNNSDNDNNNPIKETILPEETYLIKPLHRLVKATFKGIDFSEGEYYMAFVESEVATQIQDSIEEITLKEWAYFKATLQNKIDMIKQQEKKRIIRKEWEF